MTKIVRGGQSNSADHISSSQATFRSQIAAITDAVRQMGGNPEVGSGAVINDPLSAPYVLYYNPYTGSDTFVGGSYSTSGDATKRIELQRLECGYSEARPFKTINRAIIEAGIITAKSFYEQPLLNTDLVSIMLAPGASTLLNGTGSSSVSEWANGYVPTNSDLQAFNPQATGGIILPRGVSLCGLDLRKIIFRPDAVPTSANEAADFSNRRAIFKVTGTGYYYGFTFMDKANSISSHHLLSCFEFASQAELDEFYGKIRQAFGGPSNTGGINLALAVTRTPEYEIVGPAPAPGSQTIATDTTDSASPYIFNCSVRSKYGLCGIFADGAKPTGFKSIVTAQFTGVSKQRDLGTWERYGAVSPTTWSNMNTVGDTYTTYISTRPDDIRMNPDRRSFHIRAVNGAFIQAVSVFAIGQGVHFWTQSGGEIISNGGFSNFGGVAGLSQGYRAASFPGDTDWAVSRIKVANNLSAITNNIKRIYLGTVSAVTSTTITLETALGDSITVPGVPDLVARDGYTLRGNSYVWVENPLGDDWRARFSGPAWSTATPTVLNITAALTDPSNVAVPVVGGISSAIGKRVYVRRLVDTRTPEQRRYTLKLSSTNQLARTPIRDYVLQTKVGIAPIVSELASTQVLIVNNTANIRPDGVTYAAELTLRRGNTSVAWTAGTAYVRGEIVKRNNKHYTCIENNTDSTFDAFKWEESFVHMDSTFNPEDFYKNEAPIIVFDNDTDGSETSITLGHDFATVWTTNPRVQAQYRAATDYRALHLFLTSLGFSSANAHTILIPQAEAVRQRDPASTSDMGGFVPSGAANAIGNWPIEFRRPSFLQLLTHNWAWSGFLNYTKALPQYQRQLSPQNKFTYYFTNADGGRVYPTGFNEEGYQVTPRGIDDLATGQTLSVEDIGANDLTLPEPQTSFDAISANNISAGAINVAGLARFNGVTEVEGALTLSDTARASVAASTTKSGLVELASDGEAVAGASPFVSLTPSGLSKWAFSKQVVFRSTANQRIYIGTWDSVAPVAFDSTYRSSYWPAPSGVTDGNAPDGTAFRPFATLADAAAWANEYLGTEQLAQLIMKPGFYKISGVTFNGRIEINGAHIGTTGALTGGQIGNYDIGSPGNSVMLYTTPYVQPNYGTDDNIPYAYTGPGMVLLNGGDIRLVHFISADMTLGATQIPDSEFPYGSAVRTATVKASTGNRFKEWIAAFIAYYRSFNPTYPITPSSVAAHGVGMITFKNGNSVLAECTLGARGTYSGLDPGGTPGIGFITVQDTTLYFAGNRVRGNEYWDFTGVIAGAPKLSGWCASLFYCLGEVSFVSGGSFTGTLPPGLNYNLDNNNIHFERTHFGSDSRNGGTNPATAIAFASGSTDPGNPWAAEENATSRTARGPQLSCVFYAPLGAAISFPPYSFWARYGTLNDASRSGFKGKLGSIAALQITGITQPFFMLQRKSTFKYLYQYDSTPIQEAGVADGVNWTAATTAVDWGDTGYLPANVSIQTSLNLAAFRNKGGFYYKTGTIIETMNGNNELTV